MFAGLGGALFTENDELLSAALLCAFHVLLDVTKFCLSPAKEFLNLAFRFFDSALNLVFVHAHDILLITYCSERPAHRTGGFRLPAQVNNVACKLGTAASAVATLQSTSKFWALLTPAWHLFDGAAITVEDHLACKPKNLLLTGID